MKKRNNEITIKVNISDDLLGALANVIMMTNMPVPLQALQGMVTPAPTTKTPLGFRSVESTKTDGK